jgi:LuxR family transcriptional regulator, maltose regulon positive regulatory protein
MTPGKLPLLLTTKVVPPRMPPGLIDRPRLLALVEQAQRKQLILVRAPAGFGKSSLAIVWAEKLRQLGSRVAWLALDADDDEPARFLHYVVHSLRRACNSVGVAALGLTSETFLVPSETIVTTLINELAEIEDDVYLFLDDYHRIADRAIHDALWFFLSHAPSHFHLVILSRSAPPLPLAALRAQNQLLEIGSEGLRFDLDETREFLQHECTAALPPSGYKMLHNATEGWAAALRIAASSLAHGNRDFAQYISGLSGASRPIGDYIEGMLAGLPVETVSYMLRTAVLDRLTAPLCQAVTGMTDSQELLESIAGRQLLLQPLDPEGRWYRYHHLLAEYLSQQLQARFGGEVPELHRRAYRWYASHEYWTDAVKHAIAAGETDQAMAYVGNCAMPLVKTGDLLTLLGWQRSLPGDLMRGQIKVKLAIAWGLALAMRFEQALALLAQIEQDVAPERGAEAEDAGWECQTVRSVVLALKDDSQAALTLAESCYGRPSTDLWNTNVLSNVIRFGHWKSGNLEALYATPWIPYSLEEDRRNVLSSVYRLLLLGLAEFEQARLAVAERHFVDAMRLAQDHAGPQSTAAALCAPMLARIRYEQGALEEAEAMIVDRIPVINATVLLDSVLATYELLVRVALARSNVERAYALLEQAENLGYERGWDRLIAAALLERTRLYLAEGRITEASACLVRLERSATACRAPRPCAWTDIENYHALGSAYLAIARNRSQEAIDLLALPLQAAEGGHREALALRLRLTIAVALLAANERVKALEAFRKVLRVAATAGFFQTILEQGPEVGILLLAARETVERSPYAKDELACIDRLLLGWRSLHKPGTEHGGNAVKEALSARERNILELIAEGQSNKEIARTLGVAPETVKSHLKNIFVKLDVEKRAQAVARAQTLGLVRTGS